MWCVCVCVCVCAYSSAVYPSPACFIITISFSSSEPVREVRSDAFRGKRETRDERLRGEGRGGEGRGGVS